MCLRLGGMARRHMLAPQGRMEEDATRISLPLTFPAHDGLHDDGIGALDGRVEPLQVADDELGKAFGTAFGVSALLPPAEDLERAAAVVDQAITAYAQRRVKPTSTLRVKPVLFPPGTNMHIYRDGRGLSAAYVPCTFFSAIEFSLRMADDHFISEGYDRAFQEILASRSS